MRLVVLEVPKLIPGVRHPDEFVVSPEPGKATFSLGRHIDNDFILADSTVSRRHLEIILGRENIHVRDLGSENGTLINSRRLPSYQTAPLKSGDHLRLGGVLLRIETLPQLEESLLPRRPELQVVLEPPALPVEQTPASVLKRRQAALAAPALPSGITVLAHPFLGVLVYLGLLVTAGIYYAAVHPLIGLGLHLILLALIILQAALSDSETERRLLTVLSVPALFHMVNLVVSPAAYFEQPWYPLAAPIGVLATIAIAGQAGTNLKEMLSRAGQPGLQALLAGSGLAPGALGYWLARPETKTFDPLSHPLQLLIPLGLIVEALNAELVLRGLVQEHLARFYGAGAIIFTGLLTPVVQAGYSSPTGLIFWLVPGFWLGYVVYRTGKLTGAVLAHAITSLTCFLALPWLDTTGFSGALWFGLAGGICALLAALLLKRSSPLVRYRQD